MRKLGSISIFWNVPLCCWVSGFHYFEKCFTYIVRGSAPTKNDKEVLVTVICRQGWTKPDWTARQQASMEMCGGLVYSVDEDIKGPSDTSLLAYHPLCPANTSQPIHCY